MSFCRNDCVNCCVSSKPGTSDCTWTGCSTIWFCLRARCDFFEELKSCDFFLAESAPLTFSGGCCRLLWTPDRFCFFKDVGLFSTLLILLTASWKRIMSPRSFAYSMRVAAWEDSSWIKRWSVHTCCYCCCLAFRPFCFFFWDEKPREFVKSFEILISLTA